MVEERFPAVSAQFTAPLRDQPLPPTAVAIVFTGYLLLNLGCVLLMADSLILGIMGMGMINLLMFLFLWPQWITALYILIAAPSIVIPLGTSGILSRLFAGDLVFALLVMVGVVGIIRTRRKSQQSLHVSSLMIPLVALALVGLSSIIYSRMQPDPRVIYSFPHASVPLILVNGMEMILLISLPAVLLIAPGLMRTIRDVKWIVRAFLGIGMLYALGTIFAGPLGLFSKDVILGYIRPQVFGDTSSNLGLLMLFFTCITLGQALYTCGRLPSSGWWLCTLIFGCAVIMSFGRESWIVLFLSVLGMIGFRTRNLSVLFLMQVFVLLLFIPGVADFFDPQKVYGIDRLIMWKDAIAIWQRHPYFGVGAGNYQFFDIAYGTDVGGIAHNQFLEVLAEMGMQGLLCLLWCLFAVGRLILHRFRTAATPQGKAIALACIGYYIMVTFGGFFGDSFLPSVAGAGGTGSLIGGSYHWLFLGLVLTIPHWEHAAGEQDMVEPSKALRVQVWAGDGQAAKGVEVGRKSHL